MDSGIGPSAVVGGNSALNVSDVQHVQMFPAATHACHLMQEEWRANDNIIRLIGIIPELTCVL